MSLCDLSLYALRNLFEDRILFVLIPRLPDYVLRYLVEFMPPFGFTPDGRAAFDWCASHPVPHPAETLSWHANVPPDFILACPPGPPGNGASPPHRWIDHVLAARDQPPGELGAPALPLPPAAITATLTIAGVPVTRRWVFVRSGPQVAILAAKRLLLYVVEYLAHFPSQDFRSLRQRGVRMSWACGHITRNGSPLVYDDGTPASAGPIFNHIMESYHVARPGNRATALLLQCGLQHRSFGNYLLGADHLPYLDTRHRFSLDYPFKFDTDFTSPLPMELGAVYGYEGDLVQACTESVSAYYAGDRIRFLTPGESAPVDPRPMFAKLIPAHTMLVADYLDANQSSTGRDGGEVGYPASSTRNNAVFRPVMCGHVFRAIFASDLAWYYTMHEIGFGIANYGYSQFAHPDWGALNPSLLPMSLKYPGGYHDLNPDMTVYPESEAHGRRYGAELLTYGGGPEQQFPLLRRTSPPCTVSDLRSNLVVLTSMPHHTLGEHIQTFMALSATLEDLAPQYVGFGRHAHLPAGFAGCELTCSYHTFAQRVDEYGRRLRRVEHTLDRIGSPARSDRLTGMIHTFPTVWLSPFTIFRSPSDPPDPPAGMAATDFQAQDMRGMLSLAGTMAGSTILHTMPADPNPGRDRRRAGRRRRHGRGRGRGQGAA